MTQEILIGVERRRRWSDERKLAILAEVGVDGASVSDVARRRGNLTEGLYIGLDYEKVCFAQKKFP
ncbi:transposase [Acetobacter oryzoeni]|uniref:transposase n=1 Tax=Acetobacter oryzoeni TaxID=2500548 RepID=UPI003DA9FC86